MLGLLRELQIILSDAINSLEIKSIKSLEGRYLTWAAVTINQTARGFIVLRETRNIEASKLLIRPIMEALLSATAVMQVRGFLFRKLYTELMEEKKLPRPKPATKAEVDIVLADYKNLFKGFDPNYPFEENKVSVKDAAEAAQMLPLYEVVYRTYCNFTHGAMLAATGQLNQATNDLDTHFVVSFMLAILDQLKGHTPAKIPDLDQYRKFQTWISIENDCRCLPCSPAGAGAPSANPNGTQYLFVYAWIYAVIKNSCLTVANSFGIGYI